MLKLRLAVVKLIHSFEIKIKMKVSVHLVASALILGVASFCSCISLPAEVKDAMVRNHRAHVVKLIPFVEDTSGIDSQQYKTLNSEISSQSIFNKYKIIFLKVLCKKIK